MVLSAAVNNSGSVTVVRLTFVGGAVDNISLIDGRFNLTIIADQFAGIPLDGNNNNFGQGSPFDDVVITGGTTGVKLFRIFGDFDGDGSVATNDFIQFRLALGGTGFIFDFNNDGAIAANDFIQFRLRFGGSV